MSDSYLMKVSQFQLNGEIQGVCIYSSVTPALPESMWHSGKGLEFRSVQLWLSCVLAIFFEEFVHPLCLCRIVETTSLSCHND
jgi:hypothetical protein